MLVTAIWGLTFTVVKQALTTVPPLEFLAIRCTLSALILGIAWHKSVRRAPRRALAAGGLVGLALAAGYGFQTIGLLTTEATKSGFITGLYVVFTPIIWAVIVRRTPRANAIVGVVFATVGLFLLSATLSPFAISGGDLLTLACAISFGFQIALLGHFAANHDHRMLAVTQLAVVALVFLFLAPFGRLVMPTSPQVWFAIALTAIGATAFGIAVQSWVQTRISPTQTAVVFTLEPVFAGLFGFILLGERMSTRGWLGAALILGGIVLVSLREQGPIGEAGGVAASPDER